MMARKEGGLLGKIPVHLVRFGKGLRSDRPKFESLIDLALVVISILWPLADFCLCQKPSLATLQGRKSEPHQSQDDPRQSDIVIK